MAPSPFTFGIVVGAGIASNLAGRVAPRVTAGTGTLLAALALFMFSRLDVDDSPRAVLGAVAEQTTVGNGINYWADLFPWIAVMATGMGMVFVPLTLTALHRVRAEDSGIGSGVLNTMQQVGGALGLATLSTVALHFTNSRVAEVARPLTEGMTGAGVDPSATIPGTDLSFLEGALFQASFTEGATSAFLVGSLITLGASALVWIFLDVKASEMATDAEDAPVHVG